MRARAGPSAGDGVCHRPRVVRRRRDDERVIDAGPVVHRHRPGGRQCAARQSPAVRLGGPDIDRRRRGPRQRGVGGRVGRFAPVGRRGHGVRDRQFGRRDDGVAERHDARVGRGCDAGGRELVADGVGVVGEIGPQSLDDAGRVAALARPTDLGGHQLLDEVGPAGHAPAVGQQRLEVGRFAADPRRPGERADEIGLQLQFEVGVGVEELPGHFRRTGLGHPASALGPHCAVPFSTAAGRPGGGQVPTSARAARGRRSPPRPAAAPATGALRRTATTRRRSPRSPRRGATSRRLPRANGFPASGRVAGPSTGRARPLRCRPSRPNRGRRRRACRRNSGRRGQRCPCSFRRSAAFGAVRGRPARGPVPGVPLIGYRPAASAPAGAAGPSGIGRRASAPDPPRRGRRRPTRRPLGRRRRRRKSGSASASANSGRSRPRPTTVPDSRRGTECWRRVPRPSTTRPRPPRPGSPEPSPPTGRAAERRPRRGRRPTRWWSGASSGSKRRRGSRRPRPGGRGR